ncbi:Gfo/Idh/MocA family protein [Paracoccus fistulariae]|uniref:Gfo/Idh/MocA family oxidoreductase n=1 Tax=Paracoccus fistulariae TaxID=658446 RepID=A0ABY7SPD2_9RHOB|nr:Gfo/Idh/MocA family oxidoreductase [Paracoccus fistulariae]MDB6182273.1 Gfo/Idh/MocA family oxidoreductase [Paracoccus fistulariae]WCR08740.1 Gfo/Idh/MocA family oxidoreductase [Paracoccus fistulariae]
MSKTLGIGVIGAGNISAAYLRLAPLFRGIQMRAVADLNAEAAKARAKEFGIRAETVDSLLAAGDIDIVVNLTIPAAHYEVSKKILLAGKHVYSEKPFVLTLEEGQDLDRIAAEKGLRIGSAPDTFLGGSHQLARRLIDDGVVGKITSGTCFVQSPGMEMWHPNPDFFFQPGGGPVLDLGPYYISEMVQLLGPVTRVAATSGMASPTRTITSQPRFGEEIPVDTPTTFHAILQFASGAQIAYITSWDVWHHDHNNIELYGRDGTLYIPDPNFFGGELRMTRKGSFTTIGLDWDHPFMQENDNGHANYRAAGLADMALAIVEDRPHRCNNSFALHVVDVMTAILKSGDSGAFVQITTSCDRPEALDPEQARALLA